MEGEISPPDHRSFPGMAAITWTIQTLAETGDNIVSTSELYGGTYPIILPIRLRQGTLQFRPARMILRPSKPGSTRAPNSFSVNPSVIHPVASPISKRPAEIAHRHGVPLVVEQYRADADTLAGRSTGADIIAPQRPNISAVTAIPRWRDCRLGRFPGLSTGTLSVAQHAGCFLSWRGVWFRPPPPLSADAGWYRFAIWVRHCRR